MCPYNQLQYHKKVYIKSKAYKGHLAKSFTSYYRVDILYPRCMRTMSLYTVTFQGHIHDYFTA